MLANQTVEWYKHLRVDDTVHIIRSESCEYRCPICHGKGRFKATATTSDGIKLKGKMKCKYCIGIGAIAVDRYIPITATIKTIEIWNDGDIIVRTDNLYHVDVDETLYPSYESARSKCDELNTNTYVKCGSYHVGEYTPLVPNDSYVEFGKHGKFYIDGSGGVSKIED